MERNELVVTHYLILSVTLFRSPPPFSLWNRYPKFLSCHLIGDGSIDLRVDRSTKLLSLSQSIY
jgi:hypothetical protein